VLERVEAIQPAITTGPLGALSIPSAARPGGGIPLKSAPLAPESFGSGPGTRVDRQKMRDVVSLPLAAGRSRSIKWLRRRPHYIYRDVPQTLFRPSWSCTPRRQVGAMHDTTSHAAGPREDQVGARVAREFKTGLS